MILRRLSVRGFRNLEPHDLAFPAEGVALLGDNAQGKSNLLESIYYLETFRSFRGAQDAQLVAFGAEVFRVEGSLEASPGEPEGAGSVAAAYDASRKVKRVTVDGVKQDTLAQGIGTLGAVVFSPADIHLVEGSPADRRRYLDIVLSLNEPGYVGQLQAYRHALAQRNAALKAGAASSALAPWDASLCRAGGTLIAERQAWTCAYAGLFSETVETISGGERATLRYVPSGAERDTGGSAGDVEPEVAAERAAESLRIALERSLDRDRRFGNTSAGPHRDELRIAFDPDGREVRTYGSGGQRRTAALALRLVEAQTTRDRRGRTPILLLDDAFAELDDPRSGRLLGLIDSGDLGQVVLTAPKESDVRVRADTLPRWRIEAGKIHA